MAKKYKIRCRNSKCRHRRTSTKHPDDLTTAPKTPDDVTAYVPCKMCGSTKGWRIEGRFYELNTCRCDGVPYPHQYLQHPHCLDRLKKTMQTRQFVPVECAPLACYVTSASRLMYMYQVRDTMAYIAAHDEKEAIKVLENNYPLAHSLLLVQEDVKATLLDEQLRSIMVYDYKDTSNEQPPITSLWDLWVEAVTPRVLSVNATIKGLINDVQQETSNLDETPF